MVLKYKYGPLFALHASIKISSLGNTFANRAWTSQHLLSAPGYATNGVLIHRGMFQEPVQIPGRQRLKTTSTKLRTSVKTARNISSYGAEAQKNPIVPQTYSLQKDLKKQFI